MEKDTDITRVVFRVYKEGDVIALFPDIIEDEYRGYCSSYQHIGQHGAADYHLVVRDTKLAKPEQYQDLKEELEKYYGYNFQVISRWNRK